MAVVRLSNPVGGLAAAAWHCSDQRARYGICLDNFRGFKLFYMFNLVLLGFSQLLFVFITECSAAEEEME